MSALDDFLRGLQMMKSGAQNLPANLDRGFQTLGSQPVPNALVSLLQGVSSTAGDTLDTTDKMMGRQAVRAAVGLDPSRPMSEDLQDLGVPMQYASKLGPAVDTFGSPMMAPRAPLKVIDRAIEGAPAFIKGQSGALEIPWGTSVSGRDYQINKIAELVDKLQAQVDRMPHYQIGAPAFAAKMDQIEKYKDLIRQVDPTHPYAALPPSRRGMGIFTEGQ